MKPTLSIRLDPKVRAAAEKAAADQKRSLASLISIALEEYLKRLSKGKK